MKTTTKILAAEFENAREAIRHVNTLGDHAILVGGRYFCAPQAEIDKLKAADIEFAYLVDHNGQTMTIPVNG